MRERLWQRVQEHVRNIILPVQRPFNGVRIPMTMKYPFVENTLGKKLRIGSGLSVDCMTCRRHVHLDLHALVDRLGEDYG